MKKPKSKHSTLPPAGKEIVDFFKRKAGPHKHKLTKRLRTRAARTRHAIDTSA